jgi:hypothetical protein
MTRLMSLVMADLSALGHKPGVSFGSIPAADGGEIGQLFFSFK